MSAITHRGMNIGSREEKLVWNSGEGFFRGFHVVGVAKGVRGWQKWKFVCSEMKFYDQTIFPLRSSQAARAR